MNKYILIIISIFFSISSFAQGFSVSGKVMCHGEAMPFANVLISGTNMGVATNADGFYRIQNLPHGDYKLMVQSVGYKTAARDIHIHASHIVNLDFDMQEDQLMLDQVVVTANRGEVNRREAPVIVNTINAKQLAAVQSVSISEGLNFVPGLRMENNCQNCGFSQLRMNGMEGAYSQILINGRAIFSGLAGVYGLELIPASIIDRMEVVRGGGSALYGSNAIAGTVNIITKDPVSNSYSVKLSNQVIGFAGDSKDVSNDLLLNFNASMVGNNARNGFVLYGFLRQRNPYDANDDEYSEMSSAENFTLGGKVYQRLGLKGKLSADVLAINTSGRGGNNFNVPYHESDICEALHHTIYSGSLNFDRFFREKDMLSVFLSGQIVDRDSYYGANKALDAYGKSRDLTWVGGAQYNAHLGKLNLVTGFENVNGTLNDKKLAYREIDEQTLEYVYHPNTVVAHQLSNTTGVFAQADYRLGLVKASLGARYDHYSITDLEHEDDGVVEGNVLSPRVNLLFDFHESFQVRMSYSQGYRAPQIFDEDLHIETSGARQIYHTNADDLTKETSHTVVGSIDWHPKVGETNLQFTAEGFYTRLIDPFVSEYGELDENGKVYYVRNNAEGYAEVMGVNLEFNWFYSRKLNVGASFTIQNSEYSEVHEFNETHFFRTPDDYGYLKAEYNISDSWTINLTENYTGRMLIPYFGTNLPEGVSADDGMLVRSDRFFDTGLKVTHKISRKGVDIDLFAGIKNIFNSYQSDFDEGVNRDPGYIYGPILPRTIYFGVKLGKY